MTTLTSPVTVDRRHFEALVRRANCNMESSGTVLPGASTIAVSHAEYLDLKLVAQQYENLRQNLLLGGVSEDTVAILSKDNSQAAPNTTNNDISYDSAQATPQPGGNRQAASTVYTPSTLLDSEDGGASLGLRSSAQSNGASRPVSRATLASGYYYSHASTPRVPQDGPEWNETFVEGDENDLDDEAYAGHGHNRTLSNRTEPRRWLERNCSRSIQLVGITESTTHADVTAAVRGGQLLDIYLRTHDRSAMVSFVRGDDARAFFEHVRRHDLYIKNKRVDIRWSDRQFVMPSHVANKINIGATRNLVVRRCDPRATEESIREDLDHIHNLIVIKVQFEGRDAKIYTNSVHNALFARTCMMSRAKYKGSKIEWIPDECAQPIERVVPVALPKKQASPRKPLASVTNRFQLLNMDGVGGEDEETADDNTDTTSEMTDIFAFQREKNNAGIIA